MEEGTTQLCSDAYNNENVLICFQSRKLKLHKLKNKLDCHLAHALSGHKEHNVSCEHVYSTCPMELSGRTRDSKIV